MPKPKHSEVTPGELPGRHECKTHQWEFPPPGLREVLGEPWVHSPLPDTGERKEFSTGAVRDASIGKGLFHCIPPCALRALAKRYEDGAQKYGLHNWQKGIPLSCYYNSLMRHTLAAMEGRDDEDHLGAVLWNAAGWLWTLEKIEGGELPAELNDLNHS